MLQNCRALPLDTDMQANLDPSVPWLFSLHSGYIKAVANLWQEYESIQKFNAAFETQKCYVSLKRSLAHKTQYYRYFVIGFAPPNVSLIMKLALPYRSTYKVTSLTMLPHNVFFFFLSVHLEICWHMSDDNHVIFTHKVSGVPTKYERSSNCWMWKCENCPSSLIFT